jgi:hypothetical protein
MALEIHRRDMSECEMWCIATLKRHNRRTGSVPHGSRLPSTRLNQHQTSGSLFHARDCQCQSSHSVQEEKPQAGRISYES